MKCMVMSKKKYRRKCIREAISEKNLMNVRLKCISCNKSAIGEDFINTIVKCNNKDCPHKGKSLEWVKTAIGGNEIPEDQPLPTSNTEVNEYEEQPSWEFVYRDRVIK